MLLTRGTILFVCAASLAFSQEKHLTARELFYAATQPQATPPKITPAKSATATKPPVTPPGSTKTPPKRVEIAVADQHPSKPPASSEGGVKIIPAALQTAPMPANGQQPLGLRINVMRYNSDGTTTDVLPETIFRSGDRIRLGVETNGRGYLYIANQGASGTWKAMFPSPEIEDGDNRVEAMRPYSMPPGNHVFTFDSTAGKENLFVVFSRKPVSDFEELIYQLGNKKPNAPREDKTLIMAASIGDPTIERLRNTYSRDLIIETVNPATPTPEGAKRETAVYVVNPTGSADSHVVADIKLVHQ
jgi:hypothetical protein